MIELQHSAESCLSYLPDAHIVLPLQESLSDSLLLHSPVQILCANEGGSQELELCLLLYVELVNLPLHAVNLLVLLVLFLIHKIKLPSIIL